MGNSVSEALSQTETPPEPGTPATAATPGYVGFIADDAPEGGVIVLTVRPGTPADQAGVKAGDQILAVNGTAVSSLDTLAGLLQSYAAGDVVTFQVRRGDQLHALQATLAPSPDQGAAPQVEALPVPARPAPAAKLNSPRTGPRPSLGMTVSAVADAPRLGRPATVRRGAVITGIRQNSAAALYGLPIGGVIVGYDDQPIDSPQDLINAVNGSQVGQEVELAYYHGAELFRKKVRLGASSAIVAEPAPTPGISNQLENVLGQGGRRPILGQIGRALDGAIQQPQNVPPDIPAATPRVDPSDEVTQLRLQVQQLQRTVERLEQRLSEVEAQQEL